MANNSPTIKLICDGCGKNVIARKSNKGNLTIYDDVKKNRRHYCKSKKELYKDDEEYIFHQLENKASSPKFTKIADKESPTGKNYRICGYCDSLFFWHKDSNGRWIPVEEDGNIHQCNSKIPQCKNCKRPIQFIKNSSGKWQPFEIDGKAHNCANFISK